MGIAEKALSSPQMKPYAKFPMGKHHYSFHQQLTAF